VAKYDGYNLDPDPIAADHLRQGTRRRLDRGVGADGVRNVAFDVSAFAAASTGVVSSGPTAVSSATAAARTRGSLSSPASRAAPDAIPQAGAGTRRQQGKDLTIINRAMLEEIIDAKLALGHRNATVNRTMELVRAILRKCVNDWEWLDRAPKVRMLKEPTRRIRFLTRAEAQRLLAELPEHLADMAAFSLATGLRAANVTGLTWSQVDLTRKLAWVHPDQAKARRAIAVPLNAEAVVLINKQVGKHLTHVFSYKGSVITQVSTKAWYAALERAGIENFRWHDLRHTWASWHMQNGTPLFALQEMGGWESPEMVRRYAHLAADHLAPYAERLGALRDMNAEIHGTFWAQSEKQ